MKKTFGILAHVDAGKTTFSEQILYHRGVIGRPGRVDHRDTFLDSHEIERKRGITVFSDQACFSFGGDRYYLVDTPGHVDFSPEAERVMQILDYGVLLINGTAGVQAHTETLWRLLREYRLPVFIFVNKMDVPTADAERNKTELTRKLSSDVLFLDSGKLCIPEENPEKARLSEALREQLSERSDELMEAYLFDSPVDWVFQMRRMIKAGNIFPCFFGSALKDEGIESFFRAFHLLTETDYEAEKERRFSGRVYQIRHGGQGEKLTFIKALSGRLRVKDAVKENGTQEKVNQIFLINGAKSRTVPEVEAGDIFAVSGLTMSRVGGGVGTQEKAAVYQTAPALRTRVLFNPSSIPVKNMLEAFRVLEEEEPELKACWEEQTGQLTIKTMGNIQLEVLQERIRERFGYETAFGKPEVLYLETIRKPVTGYGHFEPLRHYAEAVLRLEPGKFGTGITFESRCSKDELPISYQNLIRQHVLEKEHKGVLTGSPITDIKVILIKGLYHLKHTEGGDFREAVYRAIRQGLEKAEGCLLEPYYEFEAGIETGLLGRFLSDITRLCGRFEDPGLFGQKAVVRGRAPVSTMMDYSGGFLSLTKGKGQLFLRYDGYEPCHNEEEVIKKINYQKEADLENPSSSVFCSKGTSVLVKWEEAESWMHSKKFLKEP